MLSADNPFLDALRAAGPAPDRSDGMGLYSWLIGSWDLDVVEFLPDGTQRRRPGEWHFAWVLEGRAIQDVWAVPPRGQRQGDAVAHGNRYGTTLRVYDPRDGTWRIQWTEPVSQTFLAMVGRGEGGDIIQVGEMNEGHIVRWSFRHITRASFLWRGEVSADAGATWQRTVEFTALRRGADPGSEIG